MNNDAHSEIREEMDHLILESELNDMSTILDEIDQDFLFIYNHSSDQYIQEASAKKESLPRRIWNFIKYAFHQLGKAIRWICKKIRSLFKKDKVSIDQIVMQCGIKPKNKVTHEAVFAPEKEQVIHFPASKESDIKETDLHVAVKNLTTRIERNQFFVSVPGIQEGIKYRGVHRTDNWEVNYYAACAIITESQLNDLLFDIASKIIYDSSTDELIDIEDGFIDDVNELDRKAYDPTNASKYKNGIAFNNRDFLSFQKQLSDVTAKIDKVQTIEGISDELLKSLNQFADILIGITYGMNEFNRAVNQLYMLDARYIESVNQAQDLDTFVFTCIKSGIHPKYIAYNTWLLLDSSWKSDSKIFYTKDIRPTWGQTRAVFDIKGMDVVTKLAMSGVGIIGNKNEVAITKEFRQHGVEDVIACVEEYMKNCAVIFPTAIISYLQPNETDLYLYRDKLEDLYWEHPDLHDIRGDIHIKNIGFDSSRNIVCIDYGNSPITKR